MRSAFLLSLIAVLNGMNLLLAQPPLPSPAPEPAPALVSVVDSPEIILPGTLAIESPSRCWSSAEYLFWWIKDDHVPGPLLTTGSLSDPRPAALGMPGTSVLFGATGLDYKEHSGVRLTLGAWLDDDRSIGVEAAGFVLETHTIHGTANSDRTGSPVIAQPFFNLRTGMESALIITAPGRFIGGIDIFADSRPWGGEGNLVGSLWRTDNFRADGLLGFRYLGMKDELRFDESSTVLAGVKGFLGTRVPAPDIVSVHDLFITHDDFFGGQLGVRGEYRWNGWSLNAGAKVGLGSTRQDVNVSSGRTTLTTPDGTAQTVFGGLFAQPGNLGHHERNQFTVISDVSLHVGYALTRNLSLQVGYDLLTWSNVARPSEELNRNINPRQIPSAFPYETPTPPLTPQFLYHSTDFWAQGITGELSIRF